IVFVFYLGQLLTKDEVMGVSRIRAVLLLKIDQVEIRRDQVQIRKQLLALFIVYDRSLYKVLQPEAAGIEDRIDEATTLRVELIPAVEPHKPNTGVGLGVHIQHKYALPLL